ncbi:hypothetical protein LCGC14_1188060 [marine sediment metagenome]|uniref:Adhesin domain-containing protein n=1 Tax=marine sediment metagenome TaxID=412755 RepID=A0A0F9PQN1_9ZZZZ
MIRSRKITIILVAVVLVGSAAVFGIVIFATVGEYEYSETYYYEPGNSSPIEILNIESDIGAINIKYNKTPTEFYAKIDLDIHIRGPLVAGKSFSDFFKPIQWLKSSSPVTFDIDTKSTTWFFFGISRRITINVTLRTDVIYDVNAFASTGAIDMNVPQNIIVNKTTLSTSTGSVRLNSAVNTTFQGKVRISTSTGSAKSYAIKTNFTQGLHATTSTGSLTLNFTSTILGGDLIGTVSTGSINIKSYNMIYAQDSSIWNIKSSTGSIKVQIQQYVEMGADVDGSIQTSTGSIDVDYKDNQASVGAQFTGSTSTGSTTYTNIGSGGFNLPVGDVFSSINYVTAIYKYELSLSTSTGSIEVQGQSAY